MIRRVTVPQQLQAQEVKQRQLLRCHLTRRWQSGLEQRARRDAQATHALHMSTAVALERGGCRIQAAQPS